MQAQSFLALALSDGALTWIMTHEDLTEVNEAAEAHAEANPGTIACVMPILASFGTLEG